MQKTKTMMPLLSAGVMLVLIAAPATANRVEGNLVGVASGNDSVSALFSDFGLTVVELAKVDDPATSNDGLVLSNFTLNDDDERISGWWDYTGVGTVDYLVVKAGPNYALYEYNDVITGNMPNMGLWDTGDLDDKGMSHVTAYQVVPEPTSAGLLILGAIGLMTRRR